MSRVLLNWLKTAWTKQARLIENIGLLGRRRDEGFPGTLTKVLGVKEQGYPQDVGTVLPKPVGEQARFYQYETCAPV